MVREKGLCMVVAEQENSEIWINGRRTKFQTPRLVRIPKNKSVRIEVRRVGYEPHCAWVRSSQPLSFHYCELRRIPLSLVK